MIRFTLISTLCLCVFACSSKKDSTATYTDPAASTTPTTVVSSGDATSRFVVSFYSTGQGKDEKTNAEFENFLKTYPKKIAYNPIHWGHEGETDYCLALTELSASEQAEFIKKANVILGKSKLVHANENAKCVNTNSLHFEGDDTYRLVVSFYSIGEGSDYKTKEEFEKFLTGYGKKIAFEPAMWGREGEVDYCLKLNELSAPEQVDFVRKAKELLSKSKLVHVDENAKCVHKQ